MNDLSLALIEVVLGCSAVGVGIYTITNIYEAIVNYKQPELFCGKCGRRLTKKMKKCPKCKVKLK